MKNRHLNVRKVIIYLLVFTLALLMVPITTQAEMNQKVKVIIGFNQTPGKTEEALIRGLGGNVSHTYSIIPSIAAELPEQAIEALAKNPRVRIIEPDAIAYEIGTYEEELDRTWGMKRIGEGVAHVAGAFGAGVKVAIIDSGIDYNHPEFKGIYIKGEDFVNGDLDPMDIDGHGTHVAGTIAALRNGVGVVGAAPGVQLYALKVLEGGTGDFSDVIAALEWCVTNDIDITNNSYGSSSDPGVQVKAAFDKSYAAGVLHIAAAGNEGTPPGKGDTVGYPAKYPSVVAVAASDSSNRRATFSSTGPTVELIAPGVSIYSTYTLGRYATMSGTSMASPHVAGVAAQVLGVNSGFSPDQIRQKLKETAEPLGLPFEHQGYGLVRADLATQASTDPNPVTNYILTVNQMGSGTVVPAIGDHSYLAGTVVDLTATPVEEYKFDRWEVDGTNFTSSSISITMDSNKTATAYFVENIPVTGDVILTASTDKTLYTGNVWVNISASLKQNGVGVPGVEITATITTPTSSIAILKGTTDYAGNALLKYRLLKSSAKGEYKVEVSAAIVTVSESVLTTFEYY
jgi:subtilisin family serine protease